MVDGHIVKNLKITFFFLSTLIKIGTWKCVSQGLIVCYLHIQQLSETMYSFGVMFLAT